MEEYPDAFDELVDEPYARLDGLGKGICKPDNPAKQPENGVQLSDFVAYMPQHSYIFMAAGEMWPAVSVNSRIPPVSIGKDETGKDKSNPAAAWLDKYAPVEQMTWAPGEPQLIEDRLIPEGGWIRRPGCRVFNLYRPPAIVRRPGDPSVWLDHVWRLYGDDAARVIEYLAHRVQCPHEKINHALVLGGAQGIGKDTLLEPVKQAVGPWNLTEVSPQQLLGRFNGFLKSVILRVSEARDLGDVNRFAFYDHMKAYTAAPPDVLRVDEKNIREHPVFNVMGVIITSNHKTDGIYLPADDRRHFVVWSDMTKDDFPDSYWNDIYQWLRLGGTEIVAEHLATLDLSGFDPKAPPPKTSAFWEIVQSSRAPENSPLADVLDEMDWPEAITLRSLASRAPPDFGEWLTDRRNARIVPHRLEECGYVAVGNPGAKDRCWKVGGKRQVIYAKGDLSPGERMQAAARLHARQVKSMKSMIQHFLPRACTGSAM